MKDGQKGESDRASSKRDAAGREGETDFMDNSVLQWVKSTRD